MTKGMVRRQGIKVVGGALGLLATLASGQASNDCGAKVTYVGSKPSGANIAVVFKVNTRCAMSTGRFAYTYRASGKPGEDVPRSAPSWRGVEGQSFEWTDEVTLPRGESVLSVKVLPASIESTKV